MAYQSWSVIYGEQPSAAKWNILGTNDASFNDGTGIGNDAITATKIDWVSTGADGGIWWEELGRTTLGSAGDTITVSSLPARKYLQIRVYSQATGGTIDTNIRFNNDSGNNYAWTFGDTTGASAESGSQSLIPTEPGSTNSGGYILIVFDVLNIANIEKPFIASTTAIKTTGAATAPKAGVTYGKWANTSDQISRVDAVNGGTGDFAIGSEIVVLGHN